MYKKGILAGLMLLGVGLVGCDNDDSSQVKDNKNEYSTQVKKVKVKSNDIKVTYSDFKMTLPKEWIKSKVNDIDIYRLEDRDANLSISSVKTNEKDLASYLSKVRDIVKDSMGVNDIEEVDMVTGKEQIKALQYKYSVAKVDEVHICQAYMMKNDNIYVFTLLSNEDDYDEDIDMLKEVLETIK